MQGQFRNIYVEDIIKCFYLACSSQIKSVYHADSLDIMCSESDRFELLSLLVHVTLVPLCEAVAGKLREETKQLWL